VAAARPRSWVDRVTVSEQRNHLIGAKLAQQRKPLGITRRQDGRSPSRSKAPSLHPSPTYSLTFPRANALN
jgi:hypothetical protein